MKKSKRMILFIFHLFIVATLTHGSKGKERKPYIVYMGEVPKTTTMSATVNAHHRLLSHAIRNEKTAIESRIHSFGRSFNGFVARLLPHEARRLKESKKVISVFPNTRHQLHTTRSWDFLGMHTTAKHGRISTAESDIIIGLLDTGIWIKSPSFDDKGFGPPPSKWKGKCVVKGNFTGCNNKVIGAQYYNLESAAGDEGDEVSPADTEGHGTHTASTAAGVPVEGASLYGIAKGTARGGVPSARIAIYKVCWAGGCTDMDILAAFDDAIADGVDILSLSLGASSTNYFEDPVAIGAFHATKKGILISCSAGNDGPYTSTVQNVAPWILTVAASSIDRQFRTPIELGNGMKAFGNSINTYRPKSQMYSLISGEKASNGTGDIYGNASACDYGTLSMNKVKGKIVFCLGNSGQDYTVAELGGIGTIVTSDEETDIAFTMALPGTVVRSSIGKKIGEYINSTKEPQAVIYSTTTAPMDAPFVASFSSRGPQSISPNILKPDVSAPGLDILAAYTELLSVSGDPSDKRFAKYNIMSGTSMACPHATGAAAYVKSFHPDWSPAAIKSALLTTAIPMKKQSPDAELGSGAGQINPKKAVDPGLVYDLSMNSYIIFLCKEGYNTTTLQLLIGGKKHYNCSNFKPAQGIDGLNYPTFHLQLKCPDSPISAEFHRTVTHVGQGKTVYNAKVTSLKNLRVTVIPNTLTFDKPRQRRSFKVVLEGPPLAEDNHILSASLEWSDSKHSVRSPIVVCKPEGLY